MIATEGQRLLARVPGSLASIAEAVGVAKNTVSCWRRGTKIPTAPARAALRDRYGIDPRAWESSPARGRVDLTIGAPPLEPDEDPEDAELEEADDLPEGATTLDEVIAHAGWLRKARHQRGLSASERTKRATTYTQTLRLKHELEEASRSLSDRYWASDVGQAFARTLLAAVKPFPAAAKAVADAVEAAQS